MKKDESTYLPVLLLSFLLGVCVNQVDAQKLEQEWVNLFEGDSLERWESGPSKAKKAARKIGNRWSLEKGVLRLDRDAQKGRGGQIWTKKHYSDFELKFEFNIAPDGNSGVKYRTANVKGRALGCEYEIIDDENYRDNKNPTHRTACLYELVPVPQDRKWNPAGEWNHGRILVSNNQFEHWLNGEKVMSIRYGSEEWKERFAESKYKGEADFAKNAGPILLQDHQDSVSYRNVYVRELPSKPVVQAPVVQAIAELGQGEERAKSQKGKSDLVEPVAFTTNCKACHLLDQVMVGPSLVELAELYPRKDQDKFIQWCLNPGHKRAQMPQMPSMAHIPKEQLNEIYDYLKVVTVGVSIVKPSRVDPYATTSAKTKRPRIVRTFVPESGPASLILALPTSEKHNVIWDTDQCRLRYISVGEPDNYPYLKGNGNALAVVGDIVYRELNSIFSSKNQIQYKGYHVDQKGYPSFVYQVDGMEVTEMIGVVDESIVRRFVATSSLPAYHVPEILNKKINLKSSRSEEELTLVYTFK